MIFLKSHLELYFANGLHRINIDCLDFIRFIKTSYFCNHYFLGLLENLKVLFDCHFFEKTTMHLNFKMNKKVQMNLP